MGGGRREEGGERQQLAVSRHPTFITFITLITFKRISGNYMMKVIYSADGTIVTTNSLVCTSVL
jgi:hypothetical protein